MPLSRSWVLAWKLMLGRAQSALYSINVQVVYVERNLTAALEVWWFVLTASDPCRSR